MAPPSNKRVPRSLMMVRLASLRPGPRSARIKRRKRPSRSLRTSEARMTTAKLVMAKVPNRDLKALKVARRSWAMMSPWVRKEAVILPRTKRRRHWTCANLNVRKRCSS